MKDIKFPNGETHQVKPLGMKRSVVKRLAELYRGSDASVPEAVDFFFDLAIEGLTAGGVTVAQAEAALESVPFGLEGIAFISEMLGIKLTTETKQAEAKPEP
jgi:hypothetical protein